MSAGRPGRASMVLTPAVLASLMALQPAPAYGQVMPPAAENTVAKSTTTNTAGDASSDIDMGEMVVREARVPRTSIHRARVDLEGKAERFTDLSEELERLAGVKTDSLGGLGTFSALSVRGSTPSQVQVFLDGVPLGLASGGAVDLSTLPVETLADAQLFRNTAPLFYGDPGIGGVLALRSRGKKEGFGGRVTQSAGSLNTRISTANLHHGGEHWWTELNATTQGGDGDFRFTDDRGTLFTTADDTRARRENNHFRRRSLTLGAGVEPLKNLGADAFLSSFDSNRGVPTTGAFQARHASLKQRRRMAHLRVYSEGWETPAGTVDAAASAYVLDNADRLDDRQGEVGVGAQDSLDRVSLRGWKTTLAWTPAEVLTARVLAEQRVEAQRTRDSLATPARAPRNTRSTLLLGGELEGFFLNGDLNVRPSLRTRTTRSHFQGRSPFSPMTGMSGTSRSRRATPFVEISYRLLGDVLGMEGETRLQGGIGRSYREPSFRELFGDRGNVAGNDALRPESGLLRDIGFGAEYRFPDSAVTRALLRAAWFDNEVRDLIIFVRNSQQVSRARNVFDARIRGLEAGASAEFLDSLTLGAGYTFQDTEDRSRIPGTRGKNLPGRPRTQVDLSAEGTLPLVEDMLEGTLFWNYELADENFRDSSNFIRIPRREIHNLGVTLRAFERRISLTVEVRNMTADQVADFEGFPLPGRTWMLTLSGTF